MATYIVTRVRKELAEDRRHRHIVGVCTEDGRYYTRLDIVDSINAGHTWLTRASGCEAQIEAVSCCSYRLCFASPYIQTRPDSTDKDNVENLDEC